MKLFAKVLLPISLLLSITACSSGHKKEHFSDFDNIDKDIVTLTTTSFQEGGRYYEGFDDVSFRYFAHKSRYLFIFESNIDSDPSFRVETSREESVTIEMDEFDVSKFYVVTHTPGDSIITIYNSLDMTVYRNVIRVRTGFNKDDVLKAVYQWDIYSTPKDWEGFFGNWSLSLLSYKDPIYGSIKGGDDLDQNVSLSFTVEYAEFQTKRDAYLFTVTESEASSSGETKMYAILISRCADVIYAYYEYSGEGLLLSILKNPNR